LKRAIALVVAFAMVACSGVSTNAPLQAMPQSAPPQNPHISSHYIKHVIVMIQENRSFDNFFARFPGADGTKTGEMKVGSGDKLVKLTEASLVDECDFGHSYKGFEEDYDGGKMDGFNLEGGGSVKCPGKAGIAPYQYVNPNDIGPYWDIAKTYVLGDHMFQTQGSGSYTAHQDLIRGATTIDKDQTTSLVDFPSSVPWGCDAQKPSTVTSLLVWSGTSLEYQYNKGPFPCTNKFPALGKYYATLRDLLDAKQVTWKYYSPAVIGNVGKYWNAFDTVAAVRYGPEWGTNVTMSATDIFDDISGGTLPSVAWLIPDNTNSDHPGGGSDTGPSWVASVVNAIGQSAYWKSTAVIVVWDDWGGFYDHVPPPLVDHWGGLGFRVPLLLVSAYARETNGAPGYVEHQQYEFGSILKFIENNWNLGSLGTTDVRATSIVDCFDFTQPARSFVAIPSKYSAQFFRHQRPSNKPVDTE